MLIPLWTSLSRGTEPRFRSVSAQEMSCGRVSEVGPPSGSPHRRAGVALMTCLRYSISVDILTAILNPGVALWEVVRGRSSPSTQT